MSATKALDYSYLDAQNLRSHYLTAQDSLSMKFHVQGVKCGKCAQKIESLQDEMGEIKSLRFNMSNHQLQLELSHAQGSFANVVQAIESKGFVLTPIETKNDLEALNKKEDKKNLFRLGLAAACASNIMMFSFANYFGASGEMSQLFNWLSFFLYLPVLFYAATPFYQGFWQSLKDKKLSVDGPLTVASIGGFIFSSFNLIRGSGGIYFDSLAGFLFLIILSRHLQRQLQKKFLSYHGEMPSESLSRARLVQTDQILWTATEALKVGDKILVQRNEIIPVDGNLLSAQALISTAYLNGESQPLVRLQGAGVMAGSILRSHSAEIQVSQISSDSLFSKLCKQVAEQNQDRQKSSVQNLSDLWSQILLITVFSIAALFFALNAASDFQMASERALALIVLACPCAMAFGTPLALSFSLRNAFKKGFLIRSTDVFEKIVQVENVVFDKTGTLTGKNLQIINSAPWDLSIDQINIILSLENISQSSYAEAFRNYFSRHRVQILPLEKLKEIPGEGVEGRWKGHLYELKSIPSLTESAANIGFFKDGILKAQFQVEEKLNEEMAQLIQSLKKKKLGTYILSGDRDHRVNKIAQALEIPLFHTFSGMSPRQKEEKVKSLPHAMMIGDGVNDSLAFQAAHVGVAVQGSVEMALKSSDIYLLSDRLEQIDELFIISRRALKLIKGNLWISLAYNLLGGTAALLGFINPFTAALLMPVSSGFILLSTWWGSRQ